MKRQIRRYAEGMLTDSSGNPVRSSSGEPVRTRFGKDKEEDRPKSSGVEDYESLGKRAGATSTMSGPIEYIKPEKADDYESDSVADKGAENLESESDKDEEKKPVKKKAKKKPKPKPRYSDVVSSKDLGSQDFSSKAKPASSTGNSGLSKATIAAGLGLAGAAGAGLLAGRRGMKSGTRGERSEPTMGGTTRSPVRSMTAEEASFENEGGRYLKKGGATKKMASGGKVSSASSRGDGIAQRGKTRGKMC
jgi:hypothetical protein